jgi:hypothetical protein
LESELKKENYKPSGIGSPRSEGLKSPLKRPGDVKPLCSPYLSSERSDIKLKLEPKLEKEESKPSGSRHLQTSGTRYYGKPPPESNSSKTSRKTWATVKARKLEQEFGLGIMQIVMR